MFSIRNHILNLELRNIFRLVHLKRGKRKRNYLVKRKKLFSSEECSFREEKFFHLNFAAAALVVSENNEMQAQEEERLASFVHLREEGD